MLRLAVCTLVAALAACSSSSAPLAASAADAARASEEVSRVLDDWHDAAARSDEPRYFSHFAADGVFLGTDATERWSSSELRAYAHPRFSEGRGWVMRSLRRSISLSSDASIAWFDEDLQAKNLGAARGSGVLVRGADGVFKIAQYNLAITVPNARFAAVKAVLDAASER